MTSPNPAPRIEAILRDGDIVDRLKQFRLRWQEDGDLTYLGKALVDAVVEIEALRKPAAKPPASGVVDAVAVKEIILEAMQDLRAEIHGDIDGADQAADWAAAKIAQLAGSKPNFPFAWAWQDDDLVWQATCDEDRAHHSARVKGYEVVDLFRTASPAATSGSEAGGET